MSTVLPLLTPDQFAQRMAAMFPNSWVNTSEPQPGGVLYSLMYSVGTQFNFEELGIQYAKNTARIATATDTALDTVALDFFGSTIMRFSGESDSSFRVRIQNALFTPSVTRTAIQNAVKQVVGHTPRMGEPWSPGDTAVIDGTFTYLDVDSAVVPSRIGDPSLRYQGFVETTYPLFVNSGGNPIYGISNGWAFGSISSSFWAPAFAFQNPQGQVYNTILKTKAEGTIVWVKFITLTKLLNAFISGYNYSYYGKDVYS